MNYYIKLTSQLWGYMEASKQHVMEKRLTGSLHVCVGKYRTGTKSHQKQAAGIPGKLQLATATQAERSVALL